ncbi:hypothetical protein QOT17_016992 [Balamuthia mandrillaris]
MKKKKKKEAVVEASASVSLSSSLSSSSSSFVLLFAVPRARPPHRWSRSKGGGPPGCPLPPAPTPRGTRCVAGGRRPWRKRFVAMVAAPPVVAVLVARFARLVRYIS